MLCNLTDNILPSLARNEALEQAYEVRHDEVYDSAKSDLKVFPEAVVHELNELIGGECDQVLCFLIADVLQGRKDDKEVIEYMAGKRSEREIEASEND